jgi:hypothetical protein
MSHMCLLPETNVGIDHKAKEYYTVSSILLLFVFGLFFGGTLHAQSKDTIASIGTVGLVPEEVAEPFLKFSGEITLTSDLYSHSASPDSGQKGRRPPSLHRLIFTPTLTIGGLLSLPFNIILTSPETNTNTPSVAHPTIAQFLQNPANSLGFSSISPKIGWAQFNAGSFTPTLTPLTAGDLQLFGGGFDLRPAGLQFSASAGVAQRAVEPDAVLRTTGRYRRDLYGGRVGIGDPDSTSFGVNVVYAKDDLSSLSNNILSVTPAHASFEDPTVTLPADTSRLQAQEGAVASINVGVAIGEGIVFKCEGATSVFTRNQKAEEKKITGNPLASVFTMRNSTQTDLAGSASFGIKRSTWAIALSGLYMGAGYVPIGYTFLQSDRFEWKVSPELKLFDRKLELRGSLGQRVNNLSKTKGETSTLMIGSGYMNAEFSDAFSLSATYSNFGIRNDQRSDTLKVQNVSQSISIDPTVMIIGETLTHMIGISAALDAYDDYNTVSGALNSNKTRSLTSNYSLSFSENPLSIGLIGTYLENELPLGTLILRSVGVTAGYSLFDRKFVPSLSLTLGGSTDGGGNTDKQIFLRGGFRWEIFKDFSLSATAGNNRYRYGNPITQGSAFDEKLIQLALTTRF